MSDLTKLILETSYDAFKNNREYEGTYSITGTTSPGTNVKTTVVSLLQIPDLTDVVFNGNTDTVFGSDPRPADGWFHQGAVWVRGDNAGAGYTNYPTPWSVYSSISGTSLTITMIYVQQFSAPLTLTPETLYYKLVDYSVF